MLRDNLRPSGSLDGSRQSALAGGQNPGRLPVRIHHGAPYKPEWPKKAKPHLGDQIEVAKREYPSFDVVLAPGCYGTSINGKPNKRKHWPHWKRVLSYLKTRGLKYTINLHGRDSEVFDSLEGPKFKGSLVELAVVLAKAKLLVSVDSGVAHLGSLVGCPVIELLSQVQPGFPEGEARLPTQIKSPVYGLIEARIEDIDPGIVITTIDWVLDDC